VSALSALGVAPENVTFPAVVNCPLCQQNTLHLFDDLATDGIWLHCNSCQVHGDIITFGASLWNTSLPDALNRFADLNLVNHGEKDNMAGEYDRAITRHREIENFWFDAEAQIWNHSDDLIACRLRELGVQHEINAAGLVGVAYPDQIEKICRALGRAKPRSVRPKGTSLVFPYYDLPGRLTGVLLVQYTEEFEAKQTFVPTTGYKRRRPEAGYFLLKTALQPVGELLKNTQFIVDNPFWALSMQCEHLQRGLPLLPLMCSYTGHEANSYGLNWHSFPPLSRIFQSRAINPELVSRACTARGYVTIMSQTQRLQRRLSTDALSRLTAMRVNAETWQTSLYRAMSSMSEIAAHSFASRLTITPDKLTVFLKKISERFSAGFADRVLSQVNTMPSATTPKLSWRWLVTPRSDGWWSVTNQRICSANVVINKIVHSDDGEKTYSGVIYLAGEEFPFSDSANKIERMGLLAFAEAHVAQYRKLLVFDRTWNRRSHLISIELNNPEFINVSNRLGWDDKANVFRFANYEIKNDGTTAETLSPTKKHRRVTFPEPVKVAPPSIRTLLTPSPENAFTWSIFASVAAGLINPILRREHVATAVTGENFDTAVKIGEMLGCEHLQAAILRRADVSKHIYDKTNECLWPTFVSSTFDDTSVSPIVPKCHNRPLLVKLSSIAAAAAQSYGWQVVDGRASSKSTDFSVLRYVLPAYIQHTLKNRMRLSLLDQNTTLAVLADVSEWLNTAYGATFQLEYAAGRLSTQTTADTAFLAAVYAGIQTGKIDVLPQPRKKDQPTNYILRKKEHWWLNQRAIDRYFYSCKALPPNWLQIVEQLTANDAFKGEAIVHGMPGILVTTELCDQYLLSDLNAAREIG